jgi:hypothetical protein
MHPQRDIVVKKKSRRVLTCDGLFCMILRSRSVSDSVRPDSEIFTRLYVRLNYFPPESNQFQWTRNPFMFPLAEQGLIPR